MTFETLDCGTSGVTDNSRSTGGAAGIAGDTDATGTTGVDTGVMIGTVGGTAGSGGGATGGCDRGGITGGANGCDVMVRGCVTLGPTGGVGLIGVGCAGADGGATGRTNGMEPDGFGGCMAEPGAIVGRAGANGARGGVLPVTPTDGNGRGVLPGPEPGIGGGRGGTS